MSQKSAKAPRWINGLDSRSLLSEAARLSIEQRLNAVLHFLPLAAKRPDECLEYVHQLRVSTRRAQAALDLYVDLLPKRRAREIRRDLKLIRKASGEARDLDVMLERFKADQKESPVKGLKKLLQFLSTSRQRAQRRIVRMRKRMRWSRFERRCQAMLKRIRWRGRDTEPDFEPFAFDTIERAAARFLITFNTHTDDVGILHEMRVEAKRLRYTLELAEPILGEPLRTRIIPHVTALQESLGRISDHDAASRLFAGWAPQSGAKKLLNRLACGESSEVSQAILSFRAEWTDDRLLEFEAALRTLLDESRGAHC